MAALSFFDANAVYCTSATSASETQVRSWLSQIARGYLIVVQASPSTAAIAAPTSASILALTEKNAAAPADRGDHLGAVVRRVHPYHDRAHAARTPRSSDGPGGESGRAAGTSG